MSQPVEFDDTSLLVVKCVFLFITNHSFSFCFHEV
jgi:hypothetical protein